jgi:predicted O-methyltransferase YrrM
MSVNLLKMTDELYAYLDSVNDREPPALRALREESMKDPRFNMAVSPMEGQFLSVLVRMLAPKKICEVGVYTGYSSLSMALALPPGGTILCCDISKEFTDIARRYWNEAGVADKIELRLGPGVETLAKLIAEKKQFDFIFIDANKDDYDSYYEQALVLAKQGALIAIDNTLFAGRVVGQNMEGLADWQIMFTEHVKKLNAKLHKDPRVALAMIAVGDGITLCVKN